MTSNKSIQIWITSNIQFQSRLGAANFRILKGTLNKSRTCSTSFGARFHFGSSTNMFAVNPKNRNEN